MRHSKKRRITALCAALAFVLALTAGCSFSLPIEETAASADDTQWVDFELQAEEYPNAEADYASVCPDEEEERDWWADVDYPSGRNDLIPSESIDVSIVLKHAGSDGEEVIDPGTYTVVAMPDETVQDYFRFSEPYQDGEETRITVHAINDALGADSGVDVPFVIYAADGTPLAANTFNINSWMGLPVFTISYTGDEIRVGDSVSIDDFATELNYHALTSTGVRKTPIEGYRLCFRDYDESCWEAEVSEEQDGEAVRLTRISTDGCGFAVVAEDFGTEDKSWHERSSHWFWFDEIS